MVLGTAEDHIFFDQLLKSKFEVRKTGEVGFKDGMPRSLQMLQRTVTVRPEAHDGNGAFFIEADEKHVPTLLKDLGLENCSIARTPRVRRAVENEAIRTRSSPLTGALVTTFRSGVMRCSYLAQDRSYIAEAVRVLACNMAAPLAGDLTELKRLARYLAGRRRARLE